MRTRLCLISKSNHHEDYQLARRLLPLHTLCGHDVDNDDGQPSPQVCYCVDSTKRASPAPVRACMLPAQPVPVSIFLLVLYVDDNAKANCSVVAAAAAALLGELPMPAERPPAAYPSLCMRAAPKRTRVQTVCKRAADVQRLLESVARPPSCTPSHSLKLPAPDMHPRLLFLQISLAPSRKPAIRWRRPCTTGRDGSMVCSLIPQPALLQLGLDCSQQHNPVTGTAPSPMLSA